MATKMTWDWCRKRQVMIHTTFINKVIGLYQVDVRLDKREYHEAPNYSWTISRCGSHHEAFEITMARVANMLMTGRLTLYGRTYYLKQPM